MLQTTVDIDRSLGMGRYGQVKYMGVLYMSAMARKHPHLKLLTVSSGNTWGTNAADSAPLMLELFVKYIAHPILMPLMGQAHKLEVGSKRLIDGLLDPQLESGHFYASRKNKLSGALADKSVDYPEFANQQYQDQAYQAIHQLAYARA